MRSQCNFGWDPSTDWFYCTRCDAPATPEQLSSPGWGTTSAAPVTSPPGSSPATRAGCLGRRPTPTPQVRRPSSHEDHW